MSNDNEGEQEQQGGGEACLFTMAASGEWVEIGVGSPSVDTNESDTARFVVHNVAGELLLDTCLSPDDIYTVQRGSVLVWQDPDIGKDMALSFNLSNNCQVLVTQIAAWQEAHRANFSGGGSGSIGGGRSAFGESTSNMSDDTTSSPWAVARENLPALLLAANENRNRFCQYVAQYVQFQQEQKANAARNTNNNHGGGNSSGSASANADNNNSGGEQQQQQRPPTFYDDLLGLFHKLKSQSPPDEVGMTHIAFLSLSLLHPPFSHDQTVLAPMVSEDSIDDTIDLVRYALRRTAHTNSQMGGGGCSESSQHGVDHHAPAPVTQMFTSKEERLRQYHQDDLMPENFSDRARYIFALAYLRDMLPLTLEDGDAVAGGLLSAFILKLKQGLAIEVLDSDPNYLLSRMDAVRTEVAAEGCSSSKRGGRAADGLFCSPPEAEAKAENYDVSSTSSPTRLDLTSSPSAVLRSAITEDPDLLAEAKSTGVLTTAEQHMYHALNILHEICTMIRGSLGSAEPKEVILHQIAEREGIAFLSFVIHHSLERYFAEKEPCADDFSRSTNNARNNNNVFSATHNNVNLMSPQHVRDSTVSVATTVAVRHSVATSSRRTQQPTMSHDWLAEILKCVDIVSHMALFAPVLAREHLLREEALRLVPQARAAAAAMCAGNGGQGVIVAAGSSSSSALDTGMIESSPSTSGTTTATPVEVPPASLSPTTSTIVVSENEASLKVDGEGDDMPPPANVPMDPTPEASDEVPPQTKVDGSANGNGQSVSSPEIVACPSSPPPPTASKTGGDEVSEVPETPLHSAIGEGEGDAPPPSISPIHPGKPMATQLLALFGQVEDTVLLQGLHDCILSCSFGIAPNQTMAHIAMRGAHEIESTLTLLLGFWTVGRLPIKLVENLAGIPSNQSGAAAHPEAAAANPEAAAANPRDVARNQMISVSGSPAIDYLCNAATPMVVQRAAVASCSRASPHMANRTGGASGRVSSALAEECSTYHSLRVLTALLNASMHHSKLDLGGVGSGGMMGGLNIRPAPARKCFISDAVAESTVASAVSNFIQQSTSTRGGSAKLTAQCSSFLSACATAGSSSLEDLIIEEDLLGPIVSKMCAPRGGGGASASLRRDNIVGSSLSATVMAIVTQAEKKVHQLVYGKGKHKRDSQRGTLESRIRQATEQKTKVAAATRLVRFLGEHHINDLRLANVGSLAERIEAMINRATAIANEPLPTPVDLKATPPPPLLSFTGRGIGGSLGGAMAEPGSPQTPDMLGGDGLNREKTLEEQFEEQAAKFEEGEEESGGMVRQNSFLLGKRDRSQSQETDIPMDGIDIVSTNGDNEEGGGKCDSISGCRDGEDMTVPGSIAAVDEVSDKKSPSTPSGGAASAESTPPPLPVISSKVEGEDDDDEEDGEPFFKKRRVE